MRIRKEYHLLAVLVIVAAAVRLVVAPYSSGSDIPQFEGFANTFLRHGACFYLYASGAQYRLEGWPYNWPYPYGPVWIYVLAALKPLVKAEVKAFYVGSHYYVYVPVEWVCAVKSVLILGDLLLGLLIYYIVKARKGWKAAAVASAIYLFSPVSIYESAIYGMFDQVVALFLTASLYFFLTEKGKASGFLSAISVLTKQVAAPAVIPELINSLRGRKMIHFMLGFASAVLLVYFPIALMCPASLWNALTAFWATAKPSYTYPIPYSFNGVSALATYLHEITREDFTYLLQYWFVPYISLQVWIIFRLLKGWDPVKAMYASYAAFLATYWRVNYQYFVTLTALAVVALYLSRSLTLKEEVLIIYSSIIIPAIWVFIYPIAWWFHVHIQHPNTFVVSLMESITLHVFEPRFYVAYSLTLTTFLYMSVIVLLLTRKCLK
ncbi:MAG: DUF2029 domain-containing protein [Desulfurococcales archaeon]|nr:DUF2029 domain-containing protein [Desulfurococcales archaeon]